MHADGIGRRFEIDPPAESESLTVVEVPTDVPHIVGVCVEPPLPLPRPFLFPRRGGLEPDPEPGELTPAGVPASWEKVHVPASSSSA
jgi:hypothetical protein